MLLGILTDNRIQTNFFLFFFHMFTVKRLHRLTDYKESSPEGLSMLNMLPPFPTNLKKLSAIA
jgi:hypothetical protein